MKSRRQFIKFTVAHLTGFSVLLSTVGSWLKKAYSDNKGDFHEQRHNIVLYGNAAAIGRVQLASKST
jgi:hypothetical protein